MASGELWAFLRALPIGQNSQTWLPLPPLKEQTSNDTKGRELVRGVKQWRCFHCDFTTTSPKYAAQHFGLSEMDTPICKIAGAEEGLVGYIRKLEDELHEYRVESHATLVAAYAIQADAQRLVPAAEQRGYDKGVSDTWEMATPSAQEIPTNAEPAQTSPPVREKDV